MADSAFGVTHMLFMVLDQLLQFAAASVEHTGKVERDLGRVVGIGLAEFVRPVVKQLPLVSAFFRYFDRLFVHINKPK